MNFKMKAKMKIDRPESVFTINPGSEFADVAAQPFENFGLKMSAFATADISREVTVYNYPNPFVDNTVIAYTLPESGHANLVMTNLYGNEICVLANREFHAGTYEININTTELNLTPGIYFIKLTFIGEAETQVKVIKIIITR